MNNYSSRSMILNNSIKNINTSNDKNCFSRNESYTKNQKNDEVIQTKVTEVLGAKIDINGVYNIKPSGIGDSWLIGTDPSSFAESNYANAFKNGVPACPIDLIIPSTLTDEQGQTKKVEVIGRYAFYRCGCYQNCLIKGKTKKLTLTKQVKVIKANGVAYMDDVEEFVIEEGSVLEKIEYFGLQAIGYWPGQTESNRGILILPPTLTSVDKDGIYRCNLFHTIIYGGSHPLTNSCELERDAKAVKLKVASWYPSGQKIIGHTPDRSSKYLDYTCISFAPNITADCHHSRKPFLLSLFFLIFLSNSDNEKWTFELRGISSSKMKIALEFSQVEKSTIRKRKKSAEMAKIAR